MTAPALYVVDRRGARVAVRFDNITDRNETLCRDPAYGPPLAAIDCPAVTAAVVSRFRGGMTTRELDAETAAVCAARASHHSDYEWLASRVHVGDAHRRTPASLEAMVDALAAAAAGRASLRLSDELIGVVRRAGAHIDARLVAARDYRLRFFGWQTLTHSYTLRAGPRGAAGGLLSDDVAERPQHLYMRVALGVFVCQPDGRGHEAPEPAFAARLADAFAFYDALSTQRVSNASPTMLNAGTRTPQLSSCFQLAAADDMPTLFDTVKTAALVSQRSGGVSVALHAMRAEGAPIRSSGGRSSGVKRYVKILNEVQLYVDQGGNRPGAFAAYLAVDHDDVFTFLAMARLKGEEALRGLNAPDLKYALWVPDRFMRALEAQLAYEAQLMHGGPEPPPTTPPAGSATDASSPGDWHLFSPDEAPGLERATGAAYDALYERYVAEGRHRRVVKAGDIIAEAFKTWTQVGVPYVLFKDAINRKSNMRNVAPIVSSNLCVAGDTVLLTLDGGSGTKPRGGGRVTIAELARRPGGADATLADANPVVAWDGAAWRDAAVARTADTAKLVRVTVGFGGGAPAATVDCTPEHTWFVRAGPSTPTSPRAAAAWRACAARACASSTCTVCAAGVATRAADLQPGDALEDAVAWPAGHAADARRTSPYVAAVEPLPGTHATYCVSVPPRHRAVFNGVLTGQCCEITIPTWTNFEAAAYGAYHPGNAAGGEFGVCNLAAVCLESFVVPAGTADPLCGSAQTSTNGRSPFVEVDWVGIAAAAALEVRALNRVIDLNAYPSDECRRSNRRHRPVGVGVMGLADLLARLGLAYGEPAALAVARAAAAAVYLGAARASAELAAADGPYDTFAGSPTSAGLITPDLWVADGTLAAGWEAEVAATTGGAIAAADWAALRAAAARGMRNAYVTAYMPTATTSNVVGQNECFEPFTSNLYVRKTLAGEFLVVNRHLMAELGARGLWDDALRRELLAAGGSVQGLARVPADVKRRFRTARELHPSYTVRTAAAMAPFVCQSMSMNLFLDEPKLPSILRFLFEGWRAGLKTGMYYCHTAPATGSQKTSVLVAAPQAASAPAPQASADAPLPACSSRTDCTACAL